MKKALDVRIAMPGLIVFFNHKRHLPGFSECAQCDYFGCLG